MATMVQHEQVNLYWHSVGSAFSSPPGQQRKGAVPSFQVCAQLLTCCTTYRPSLSGPVIPPLRPTPGSSSRAQQGVSWSLRGAPVDSGHRKVDKQAPAAPAGGKHPTPAVTPVGPHLRSCHARAWPQPVGGSPSQGEQQAAVQMVTKLPI